jgi:hypothetical protein
LNYEQATVYSNQTSGHLVKATTQSADIIVLPVVNRAKTIQVVKRVKKTVDVKLGYLFDGLAENAADALFEEMYGIDEQDMLTRHFNMTRALRVRSGAYRDSYSALMNHSWVNLLNRRDLPALPSPSEDVQLMLRAYADRNQNHYKILLEELRQRFSVLAGSELQFHPMLPGNFYLCFWHATEKLELSHQERCLLVPLFNRFVMDRFGQVLSLSNQSLAEQGFNPSISK